MKPFCFWFAEAERWGGPRLISSMTASDSRGAAEKVAFDGRRRSFSFIVNGTKEKETARNGPDDAS